jgi:hypothetical protein
MRSNFGLNIPDFPGMTVSEMPHLVEKWGAPKWMILFIFLGRWPVFGDGPRIPVTAARATGASPYLMAEVRPISDRTKLEQ